MKYVRIIDENGLFIEDAFVEELTEFTIEAPCPDGFYLPKWDGSQWVEGGTAPEIITPPEPTLEEKVALLAEQMVEAQKQLTLSQEALDFLIMGGM